MILDGELRSDPAQGLAVEKLQSLHHALAAYEPASGKGGWKERFGLGRRREEPPQGLYMFGGVGRGKSMLMDLFFRNAPVKNKRRVHFHAFMQQIHARLNEYRKWKGRGDDPIPPIAKRLAKEATLLCFDEFVGGVLYIAEQHRVIRWGDAPFDMANPAGTPVQVGPGLPDKAWHGWRSITEGPDGRVYVALGSSCNICMTESPEGSIVAMNPDGSDFEVYARGIRQSVGLAFHPVTKALYFTDNNADWMGDNAPPGEMNRVDAPGQNFGFPYFGGGKARTKEFMKETPPADVQFPVVEFQAHTANLGFRFYQGETFPSDMTGDAIVAQHGSWNRRIPIGYRLMRVRFDADNNPVSKDVFVSGWLHRGRSWGRPVDVKELPDGSLLVSDDAAGVVYRITYQAP